MKTIKLVDYTYAECSGDEIRLHKDTLNDPDLFSYLLRHELGHDGLNVWGDFKHDIKSLFNFKNSVIKGFLFYLKHPKIIFRMITPIIINKKENMLIIEINPSLLMIYAIEILIITGLFMYF